MTADTPKETLLNLSLPKRTPKPMVIKIAMMDCVMSGEAAGRNRFLNQSNILIRFLCKIKHNYNNNRQILFYN